MENKKYSVLFELVQFLLPYKPKLIAAAIALTFTAGITLLMGQGIRILIDDGFIAGSSSELNKAAGFIIIIALLMAFGTFWRFYLVSWLGERVSSDIRQSVFDHLLTIHPSYFELNKSGEIMSRLTTDTTLLQSVIGSSASMALRSLLTFTGGLIMLLITNLKLTVVVLACVPLVLLPILIYGRRVRRLSRRSQDTIAHVGSYAGEVIQQIKTVQSYTQESNERRAFGDHVESAFNVACQRIKQRALLISVVISLIFSAIAAMLWIGGNDVLNGSMSGGELGAFVFYAIVVAGATATISEVIGELQRAAGAAERLLELLALETEITAPQNPVSADSLEAKIHFKQITFHYPSRPKTAALSELELTVHSGSSLALIGPSGAGKSTVFELIQRFYDPNSGAIEFGGEDIKQLSPTQLREQIAVVSQQPALFSGSVIHNIKYGNPNATEQQVEQAAIAANAHKFITELPEGYDSYLGEQGVRLSGGQRQRIAIARAILKNPRVLLLDEATSALDSHSEQQVQKALTSLMKNRTTIIIAHRLSTIVHADQIAVLENGAIVATGKHEELVDSSELYKSLAALQFRDIQ